MLNEANHLLLGPGVFPMSPEGKILIIVDTLSMNNLNTKVAVNFGKSVFGVLWFISRGYLLGQSFRSWRKKWSCDG